MPKLPTFQPFRLVLLAALLLVLTHAHAAAERIGEVTMAVGKSELTGRAQPIQTLSRGQEIFAGDVVKTSVSGHVHIRFVDGAMVSVRPNSILVIHQFKYDPTQPQNSQVRFSLEAGEVRSISGAATQLAKDGFRLNTPLAAIGVKGTDFVATARDQLTRVTVHQGAIVMAPFDEHCLSTTLGACGGSRARELSADMAGVALVYHLGSHSPVFQPNANRSDMDKLSPLGKDLNRNVDRTRADNKEQLLPESLVNTKLVWGRWQQAPLPGDQLTTDFRTALSGNEVTVGDGYYFLFRTPSPVNLLPSLNNQAEFRLTGSAAQHKLSSNEVIAASVNSASLKVNFAQHTFDTRLQVSSAQMPAQQLSYTGKIDPQTGFFSDPKSDNQFRLWGSFSLNGVEAGYFFRAPVGNGSVSGATLWGR